METEVLQLLPARGLDRSLLLSVLTGLWILWFFVERFGWVFSGLVVPGYLAAVFIVRPMSGLAIIIEAVLTYLLARGLSDRLAGSGSWSRFFGRERFFLVLLCSVLVRQHCELWIFPEALGWLGEVYGIDVDHGPELFGVGLVLVPLAANMFWKVDLGRGLWQIGVPTALSWAVLVWIILPFTNYGLSSLELTYEDVAVNFLGAAKIYVILITAAVIAASMNLYAGWDYGGILVPSLLAVAWFTPIKVATTVAEALILFATVGLLSNRWPLRTWNLEGPRKIVLVFTVGFGLKVLLATFIGDRLPGLEVTDLFGFGYLMPSLLAIKMLNRRTVGRVLAPTLAVSLAGLIIGSGIALVVEWAARLTPQPAVERTATAEVEAPVWKAPLAVSLAARLRANPVERDAPPYQPAEREQLANLWRVIDRWLDGDEVDPPETARSRARKLGQRFDRVGDDRVWALTASDPGASEFDTAPSALLFPDRAGPYIWVPRPASDAPAGEAALALCDQLECRSILYAGVEPRSGAQRRHRPILDALDSIGILQIHADGRTERRKPVLHVYGGAPPGLVLGMLGSEPDFDRPPGRLRSGPTTANQAVLRMHPADLWRLAIGDGVAETLDAPDIDAWLAARLDIDTLYPSPAAQPTPFEQRLLARLLARDAIEATPLSGLRPREGGPDPLVDGQQWTAWLDRVARLIDHRVVQFVDPVSGREARALIGAPGTPGWLVLVTSSRGSAVAVEVPRPLRQPGTWRFGLSLWREVAGSAVLIAMPRRAPNGTVEGAPTGLGSAFDAVHVGLHATLSRPPPGMVVQVRGYGAWRSLEHDAIMALEIPLFTDEPIPVYVDGLMAMPLISELERVELYRSPGVPGLPRPGLFERRPQAELIGLVNQPNAQRDHARRQGNAAFVRLWLSEAVRADYIDRDPRPLHQTLDAALGPMRSETSRQVLTAGDLAPPPAQPSAGLKRAFDAVLDEGRGFVQSRNPHRLRSLVALAAADPRIRLGRGHATSEGRTYLVIEAESRGELHRAVLYRDTRSRNAWAGEAGGELPPGLRRYGIVQVHGTRPSVGGDR